MEIYNFNINNNPYEVKIISIKGALAVVEVNGVEYSVDISDIGDLEMPAATVVREQAATKSTPQKTAAVASAVQPQQSAPQPAAGGDNIVSPMPGQVIKVLVSEGDVIKTGDVVVTIEAMKMENQVRATKDGTVQKILVSEGDVVAEGAPLISLGG